MSADADRQYSTILASERTYVTPVAVAATLLGTQEVKLPSWTVMPTSSRGALGSQGSAGLEPYRRQGSFHRESSLPWRGRDRTSSIEPLKHSGIAPSCPNGLAVADRTQSGAPTKTVSK